MQLPRGCRDTVTFKMTHITLLLLLLLLHFHNDLCLYQFSKTSNLLEYSSLMFLTCKDRFGRITEAFRAFLSYLNFQTINSWQLQQISISQTSTSIYIRGPIMSNRKLRFSRNSYLVCPTFVVQLCNCTTVQMCICTSVEMCNCAIVKMCYCTTASVHLYTCAIIHFCNYIVQVYNCTIVQLFICTIVQGSTVQPSCIQASAEMKLNERL